MEGQKFSYIVPSRYIFLILVYIFNIMEKTFYCIWTDKDENAINSYDHNEGQELITFFTEDRGYTKPDIEAINSLVLGQTYNCEYGNHSIERVK